MDRGIGFGTSFLSNSLNNSSRHDSCNQIFNKFNMHYICLCWAIEITRQATFIKKIFKIISLYSTNGNLLVQNSLQQTCHKLVKGLSQACSRFVNCFKTAFHKFSKACNGLRLLCTLVRLCNTYTNGGEVKTKKLTFSRLASQAHNSHKSLQALYKLVKSR